MAWGLFESLRFLTIRQKLLFTICFGTLLTIFLTSAIILGQISKVLERELINKGSIIATNLSKQCIEPIMHEDLWGLYKSIKTVTGSTYMPFLNYILVTDGNGKILAHSNPRLFRVGKPLPMKQSGGKAVPATDTVVQALTVLKDETGYELTVPCTVATETIGIIKVGVTDRIMMKELAAVKRNILLLAFLLSIGGIGVGAFMAYRITGPMKKVTQNIMKISKGQLKDVIPIKTAEKDEIGRMVEIFNEMAKNLKTQKEMDEYLARKEKLAMLGEFSAGLAHEIKNPLTSIKMLMQSAKGKNNGVCGKGIETQDIEIIEGEINRIDRIVRDFLAFARPAGAEHVSTDLTQILKEVIALIRPKTERLHIDLVEVLPGNIPHVMAHPDGMKQVFLNVVLNAIQAMEQGGTLKVRSSANNGSVSIHIADTGPGIAGENLDHMFDPFFTTKENGTGMGLAIVDRIIREHNGRIEVESLPNAGTRVSIELPL